MNIEGGKRYNRRRKTASDGGLMRKTSTFKLFTVEIMKHRFRFHLFSPFFCNGGNETNFRVSLTQRSSTNYTLNSRFLLFGQSTAPDANARLKIYQGVYFSNSERCSTLIFGKNCTSVEVNLEKQKQAEEVYTKKLKT